MITAIKALVPGMGDTSPGIRAASKDTRGVETRAKGNDAYVSLPTAMSSQSYAPIPAPGPVYEPLRTC